MENRKRISGDSFHPAVSVYSSAFPEDLNNFNAGEGYESFNTFLTKEALQDCESGLGTTLIIWNHFKDKGVDTKEIIAYFELAAGTIPYDDRDEEELAEDGVFYSFPYISVAEIKMFAVSEKYQDLFFEYKGEDKPIAAWCLQYIVDYAYQLINENIGFQALFLHALDSAEGFYRKNEFTDLVTVMRPLYSNDDGYVPLWKPLMPMKSLENVMERLD